MKKCLVETKAFFMQNRKVFRLKMTRIDLLIVSVPYRKFIALASLKLFFRL